MNKLETFGMTELTEQQMVNIDGGLFNTPGFLTGLELTILGGMIAAYGAGALAVWYATGRLPDPVNPATQLIKDTYDEFMAS